MEKRKKHDVKIKIRFIAKNKIIKQKNIMTKALFVLDIALKLL